MATIAIIIADAAPVWFCVAVVAREVLVGGMMSIATLVFQMERFDVSWWGKLATFLLMFAIPGFMIGSSDFPGHAGFQVAVVVRRASPASCSSWITAIAYVPQGPRRHRRRARRADGRAGERAVDQRSGAVASIRLGPMNVPEQLRYSTDHEWVGGRDGGRVRIGITDYAQDALGDVVFVQLPTLGDTVAERRHVRRGREHEVGLGHLRPGRAAPSSAINDALADVAAAAERRSVR